jgi:hypothetical protein
LKSRFDYKQEAGALVWKQPISHKAKVGERAGSKLANGYWYINLGKRMFLVHRLIFLYMTGRWPNHYIDHINGDRSDNRWDNLREATAAENLHNMKTPASNTSGLRGATWDKRLGKWHAQIRANNIRRHLGYFDTKEEAHAAYVAAKAVLHPFSPEIREL